MFERWTVKLANVTMWLVNSTMFATIVKQVALEDLSKNLTVLNAHLLFHDSHITV